MLVSPPSPRQPRRTARPPVAHASNARRELHERGCTAQGFLFVEREKAMQYFNKAKACFEKAVKLVRRHGHSAGRPEPWLEAAATARAAGAVE